jgi:ACS family allantoate permease-like MFS transporter
MFLISYCVGCIIGPHTFRPKDAPEYWPAEVVIVISWVGCLLDLLFIRWYCTRQNRRKASLRSKPEYAKLENQEYVIQKEPVVVDWC